MKPSPLSIIHLAVYNLKYKIFRTSCLGIIVAILAITLFGGSILSASLKNGLGSMEKRFGADLMIVPKGYEAKTEGILLKGEPNYFYFDQSVAQDISEIEGVSQVSSQFYLTSLSEACCTAKVQLIGFNPATDFVIQPWITKSYGNSIGDGQLIVGSDIVIEANNTLKFYGDIYPVTAQLEKTATGLDSSVFMNMNTMQQLFEGAKKAGMNFLERQEPEKVISTVLVKVDKNYDLDTIVSRIRSTTSDIEIIIPRTMITSISNNLNALVAYIHTLSAALWVLAVVVLAIVFSVTINERKKEFAVFRILGATRKKLIGIVLIESLFVSIVGGILGSITASIIVFPFSTYIGDKLQLPYLQPQGSVILGFLAVSLLLSFAVGPLTSIYSAIKISRAETYITLREGE